MAEADQLQGPPHGLLDLVLPFLEVFQGIGNVLGHRHMWPDRVALEDHPDAPAMGRDADALPTRKDQHAVNENLSRVRLLQPGNAAQGRGLSTTAWPEERKERFLRNFQREIVHGRMFGGRVKCLGKALDPKQVGAPRSEPCRNIHSKFLSSLQGTAAHRAAPLRQKLRSDMTGMSRWEKFSADRLYSTIPTCMVPRA